MLAGGAGRRIVRESQRLDFTRILRARADGTIRIPGSRRTDAIEDAPPRVLFVAQRG